MESNQQLSGGMRVLAIVSSILMIMIGFYLFFNLRSVVVLFSAAVLVNGIMLIIRYFAMKESRNGWDLISGIINILFGCVMLFGGTATRVMGVVTIEMFVAFWAIFAGFSHAFGSFGLKKAGAKNWVWSLAGGIALIICGFIYISMPLMGSALMVGIAGIYAAVSFIIGGFTGLAAALSGSGAQQPSE